MSAESELRAAEAAAPSHPLVNTTDQWTSTLLRRALAHAVNSDADYISIPSGQTVLGYNPGKEIGMLKYYNEIAPRNLSKVLEKIDPDAAKPEWVDKLRTPRGPKGSGFKLFPLTDKIKEHIRKNGLPLFGLAPLLYSAGAQDNENE